MVHVVRSRRRPGGKLTTPDVTSTAGRSLQVGAHGWIGAAGAAGAVKAGSLDANWEFEFDDPQPPLFHLPRPWMYRAPVPRTKSISAAPALRLSGTLRAGGDQIAVAGWPCSIGHNWGAEHAARWIWLHADAESAHEGRLWLDAIIGRVRLGPVTTPWIANGAVSIGGRRHRLGGLCRGVATPVTEQESGASVVLRGDGISVEVRCDVDVHRCVAWSYADPAGRMSEVVNSSVARMFLTIERAGQPRLEATSPVSAFELGAEQRAFDVPLQPFAD